jgi:hypothetical protein
VGWLCVGTRLQAKYKTPMPLAIMVSDDTHDRTLALLEANQWFGFPKDQLSLLKQEKVASLLDNDARLAILPEDKYQVRRTHTHRHTDKKPDIHTDRHTQTRNKKRTYSLRRSLIAKQSALGLPDVQH